MNQLDSKFNVQTARRLESIRLSMLHEASAIQRDTELNALTNNLAARGLAISGARLQGEMSIIFQTTESLIEKAIAYRKELAVRTPELLVMFPHLKEFQAKT
jgi:hypothetical protein